MSKSLLPIQLRPDTDPSSNNTIPTLSASSIEEVNPILHPFVAGELAEMLVPKKGRKKASGGEKVAPERKQKRGRTVRFPLLDYTGLVADDIASRPPLRTSHPLLAVQSLRMSTSLRLVALDAR
jgi:hypothetical protein